MLKQAAYVVVFSLACYLISEYRVWLDVDRVLYSRSPGACKTILTGGGSEDFAELDEDAILFSSGLNFAGNPGKISALYTNGTVEEAVIVNSVTDDNPLKAPHGISIWKDHETGITFVYVVVHSSSDEGVAVFEATRTPLTLKYIKTITDSTFSGFMNDLVVVARDQFYITQSTLTRNMVIIAIEMAFALPTGKLVFYDGTSGRTVLSGLGMANGVAISLDKRTLYVSEFSRKKIRALKIQSNGDVENYWVSNIGSGPDNIQVESKSGDLWVGTFPFMYQPADVLGFFGSHRGDSQILRVRLTDNEVTDIEAVYVNNGSVATAASVALYKNNKLFIGTVSAQLVLCDVHFLQQ